MDHDSFDRVTRLLGAAGTRRGAFGALLLTAAGFGTGEAVAKRRRKPRKQRVAAAALPGLRSCANPGPGQNLSKCDFTHANLRGANLRGANLSGAHFGAADLCGADLRGSNVHKTDFTVANLTRVDFRGTSLATAKLDAAIFCQTRRPNGTLDNNGCPLDGDICCGDECGEDAICHRGGCLDGSCVNVTQLCNLFPFNDTCCNGATCRNVNSPFITTCQLDCQSNADCPRADLECRADGFLCPGDRKCCLQKPCASTSDCPSGDTCCKPAGTCCPASQSCGLLGCTDR